jgi:hypothetical protein
MNLQLAEDPWQDRRSNRPGDRCGNGHCLEFDL